MLLRSGWSEADLRFCCCGFVFRGFFREEGDGGWADGDNFFKNVSEFLT